MSVKFQAISTPAVINSMSCKIISVSALRTPSLVYGFAAKAALGDMNASLNHVDAVNEKRRHNWAILAVSRYVMLYNHLKTSV